MTHQPIKFPPLVAHSPGQFYRDLAQYFAIAIALMVVFLGAGIVGYHQLVGLNWVDSFMNASMILGGMGPVDPVNTNGGKIFAGIYALFSGAAYPTLTALVLYPVVQRMMRVLHLRALAAAATHGKEPPPES
ncbi:MAG: hypothetical protein DI533_09120 [Cereibacter sphaeroides]|uniref:Two pore domain potassium channel family protein n=1 Tax=Cereibacter sphaeroides TaxID=1063 RepID=A0A2W5SCI3_CERSP|nr:MAG: hypothetical protein DI533_09120 [Cereibacter sphaeroides]